MSNINQQMDSKDEFPKLKHVAASIAWRLNHEGYIANREVPDAARFILEILKDPMPCSSLCSADRSYSEYLDDDGKIIFKIQFAEGMEPQQIDIDCIDYSNFHLFRYAALRDYLTDKMEEHGVFKCCERPKHP